mmetsp:Transcript_33375/g.30339  ORF Transcript_33375/g.30339 Transcript_33375/m.30339 type:complete len:208 (-) Transcript_33375:109-732(-)
MLQEIFHHRIGLRDEFIEGLLLEVVGGGIKRLALVNTNIVVELSSILITIGKEDSLSINFNFFTDSEVVNSHELLILSKNLLSGQEWSLWNSTVHLLGFIDKDTVIFKIEENLELSDSVIFKIALRDTLLVEAEEFQDVLVEFDVGGLELFSDFSGESGLERIMSSRHIIGVQGLFLIGAVLFGLTREGIYNYSFVFRLTIIFLLLG